MNADAARQFVSALWDREIVPRLVEYIRSPCKSPHFDSAWAANGHIEQAVQLAADWCRRQQIAGMSVEIVGLYWHFVDIIWIVIFTVVYLIDAARV
jgi:hypothetical protein